MDITRDIQPMANFRNHSADILRHLKDTGRPVTLAVNGRAAAVVQDAEAYQHLLDLAAEASAAKGIRQAMEDLRSERTRAARDLRCIYLTINAGNASQARAWFNELEGMVLSLNGHPGRGAATPENASPRRLLHGRKPHL